MIVDHLSWLNEIKRDELSLNEFFPDDQLFALVQKEAAWYADFVNYLAAGLLPSGSVPVNADINFICHKYTIYIPW